MAQHLRVMKGSDKRPERPTSFAGIARHLCTIFVHSTRRMYLELDWPCFKVEKTATGHGPHQDKGMGQPH